MEKKENSFRSKFSKFVKTYIIVDDDEVQETMPDTSPVDDKTKIVQAIKEENIEEIKAKLEEERSASEEYVYDDEEDEDEEFNFVQTYSDEDYYDESEDSDETEFEPDYTYEQDSEEINISSHSNVANEEEEVYSKNSNDEVKSETITLMKRFSVEPESEEKSAEKVVYHRLNRITNVNYVYYPETKDTFNLDFDIIDEEERDNEEILSFFSQTPNDDYENVAAFGVKQNAVAEESNFSDDNILKVSYDINTKDSIIVKKYDKDKAVSLSDISFDDIADKVSHKVQSEIEESEYQKSDIWDDYAVDTGNEIVAENFDYAEETENEEISESNVQSDDMHGFTDEIFELLNENEAENLSTVESDNETEEFSHKEETKQYTDESANNIKYADDSDFADDEADVFENKSYYNSFDYEEESEFTENNVESEESKIFSESYEPEDNEVFAESDEIEDDEIFTESDEIEDDEVFAEPDEIEDDEVFTESDEIEDDEVFAESDEIEENEDFSESEDNQIFSDKDEIEENTIFAEIEAAENNEIFNASETVDVPQDSEAKTIKIHKKKEEQPSVQTESEKRRSRYSQRFPETENRIKKNKEKKQPDDIIEEPEEENTEVKEEKVGFFSKMKNKLILMTEQEREEVYEQEEKEKKLAEKEKRKKMKEKEKARLEKEQRKSGKTSEKSNNSPKKVKKNDNSREVEVIAENSADRVPHNEKKYADVEIESDKNRHKNKGTESNNNHGDKNKNKGEGKKDSVHKTFTEKVSDNSKAIYEEQEKIILQRKSVKYKVAELENRKITEEEKLSIIAEKQREEEQRESIEKQKADLERKRIQKEKRQKAKKLQRERQQKAEQLRKEQAAKAIERQKKMKDSENRDVGSIKLTEINKVRTKVSQTQENRRKQIDEFFNE